MHGHLVILWVGAAELYLSTGAGLELRDLSFLWLFSSLLFAFLLLLSGLAGGESSHLLFLFTVFLFDPLNLLKVNFFNLIIDFTIF